MWKRHNFYGVSVSTYFNGKNNFSNMMQDIKVEDQCKLNSLQLSSLAPGHRAHMHVHSCIQVVVEQLDVSTLNK